jgi:aminoglycoside phosphotransferase
MPEQQSHNGPTKSTWVRRHLTLVAVATLKRFRPHASSVLFLTRGVCVKYGPFQHLSDAAAMQFIASHTSIPVPKVYCAFERKGITYIVMSCITGSPIGHNWEQRPEGSKMHLLKQLKTYMEEMRLLKPPNLGVVEGVEGGKLYDMRLQDGLKGFGPFDSVRDFHSFLRGRISASPEQIPEVNELVKKHEKAQFSTCFTHGDLNSMNVLVKGDNIVGIIDWDTAGWYPEYWEYTTAYNVNPYNGFWKDEIGKFLEEYPEAAEMEQLRQKYFGAF